MSIPYRDEQILRILAANSAGLTTGQILTIAKTQRGNELPNSNITSQRIYALRETKTPKIESLDTPTGRVHRITAAGRALLAELGPSDFLSANPAPIPLNDDIEQAPPASEPVPEQDLPTKTYPLSAIEDLVDPPPTRAIDPLAEFDQAVAIIRAAMVTVIESAWPKIEGKAEKLELLEKLENMSLIKFELREMLGEIRQFLNQFEAE
jgi:hypothetical protein